MVHNLLCRCHHIPVSARIEGKEVLVCPRVIRGTQSTYRSQNPPCAFQLDDESDDHAPKTDASLCHEPYWPRAPAPPNGDWLMWFRPKSQVPKGAKDAMNEIDLDMSVGADDTLHDAQFLLEDREGLVDEQELMVARLRALVAELRVNEVNHKDEIAGLEGRIAGLEGRIAGLEGEVVRLKAENVGLKRKVEEKEDELGKERARKRSFGGRIMPRSGGSMMTSDADSSI